MLQVKERTCSICRKRSNTTTDQLLFGEWMESHEIVVHYFCLLLSSHLPQLGKDEGGILGFKLRDIRAEIRAATKRQCCFCRKMHASIRCSGCKEYFHLSCGRRNFCQFEFCDEFRSYCRNCTPLDEYQRKWEEDLPSFDASCFICQDPMGLYNVNKCIHANCCGHGFVHTVCMQEYALSAGYYLRCLWCGDTKFREHVRRHGVFVPDRDAQWERQKNAFRDLYRGHSRCDMPVCKSPRGRDYITSKWAVILCHLCGSIGAHNPFCIPGREKSTEKVSTFKCTTCMKIENTSSHGHAKLDNNTSLYMQKFTQLLTQNVPVAALSEDDSISSCSSVITVLQGSASSATQQLQTFNKRSDLEAHSEPAPFFAPHSSNVSGTVEDSDENQIIDLCETLEKCSPSQPSVVDKESESEYEPLPSGSGEDGKENLPQGTHIDGISNDNIIGTTGTFPAHGAGIAIELEDALVEAAGPSTTLMPLTNVATDSGKRIELYEFDKNLNCVNRWYVQVDGNITCAESFDCSNFDSIDAIRCKYEVEQAPDLGLFEVINSIIAEANAKSAPD